MGNRGNRTGWALIAALAVAVVVGTVVGDDEDDEPASTGRKLTPTEAACEMLADGDTATEAFDILVELGTPEMAASRAVNRAIADGC